MTPSPRRKVPEVVVDPCVCVCVCVCECGGGAHAHSPAVT